MVLGFVGRVVCSKLLLVGNVLFGRHCASFAYKSCLRAAGMELQRAKVL